MPDSAGGAKGSASYLRFAFCYFIRASGENEAPQVAGQGCFVEVLPFAERKP